MSWSRPVFLAFRVLGAEVFAVEFGPGHSDDDKPKLEGGPGGTVEMGFTYSEDMVVAKDKPCR